MKLLDKRTINRLQEGEVQNYQGELLERLPDLEEKCERVDTALLLSQLPLRGGRGSVPGEEHTDPREASPENGG